MDMSPERPRDSPGPEQSTPEPRRGSQAGAGDLTERHQGPDQLSWAPETKPGGHTMRRGRRGCHGQAAAMGARVYFFLKGEFGRL